MGRKHSSAYLLQRKLKETYKMLRLRKIKARSGLICPKCYQPTMFIKPKGPLLILIGCTKCGIGELLPRHPTWKSIDLYNFVGDNWREVCLSCYNRGLRKCDHPKPVPVFHYKTLSDATYEFLREHVTLGKIKVDEVTE